MSISGEGSESNGNVNEFGLTLQMLTRNTIRLGTHDLLAVVQRIIQVV